MPQFESLRTSLRTSRDRRSRTCPREPDKRQVKEWEGNSRGISKKNISKKNIHETLLSSSVFLSDMMSLLIKRDLSVPTLFSLAVSFLASHSFRDTKDLTIPLTAVSRLLTPFTLLSELFLFFIVVQLLYLIWNRCSPFLWASLLSVFSASLSSDYSLMIIFPLLHLDKNQRTERKTICTTNAVEGSSLDHLHNWLSKRKILSAQESSLVKVNEPETQLLLTNRLLHEALL